MKLKAKRNITVNGKNNLKGSIIEVDDKDAKVILDRDWAEKVEEKTEPTKETAAKKTPAKEKAK